MKLCGRDTCAEPPGADDLGGDGCACASNFQPRQFAANGALGIDAPEHDIDVGEGGARAALPIGDRSSLQARAFKPQGAPIPLVYMGDGNAPAPMVEISIEGVWITRPKSMVVFRLVSVSKSVVESRH